MTDEQAERLIEAQEQTARALAAIAASLVKLSNPLIRMEETARSRAPVYAPPASGAAQQKETV